MNIKNIYLHNMCQRGAMDHGTDYWGLMGGGVGGSHATPAQTTEAQYPRAAQSVLFCSCLHPNTM